MWPQQGCASDSTPGVGAAREELRPASQLYVASIHELVRLDSDNAQGHTLLGMSSRRIVVALMVLLTGLVFTTVPLYLMAHSTGWAIVSMATCVILISGLMRLLHGRRRDILPTRMTQPLSMLWCLAAVLASAAAMGRCACAAGVVTDFVCDLCFSLLSSFLLCMLFLVSRKDEPTSVWQATSPVRRVVNYHGGRMAGSPGARRLEVRDECTCGFLTCTCCCWLAFFCCMLLSSVLAILSIFHSGATLGLVRTCNLASACNAEACISYRCEGEIRNGTVVIIVNGFAASAPQYWFLRDTLRHETRTCTYDSRGSGWSTWPGRIIDSPFGFRADAMDVRSVLSAEFELAAISPSRRTAVLAAHSRGFLVSVRFHAEYAQEFGRVVVVSYDAARCTGAGVTSSLEDDMHQTTGVEAPEGTIRYAIAPIMPFLAGAVDIAPMFVSTDDFYAGQDVSRLPRSLVKLLPREAQLQIRHRYTLARYWERCALTRERWVHGYHGDGPTLSECAAVVNGPRSANVSFLGIRAGTVCEVVGTFTYCAGHTSMVQLEPFALLASNRTAEFLHNISVLG